MGAGDLQTQLTGQASRDSYVGHLEAELCALDLYSTPRPEHTVTVSNTGLLGARYAPGPGLAQPV